MLLGANKFWILLFIYSPLETFENWWFSRTILDGKYSNWKKIILSSSN